MSWQLLQNTLMLGLGSAFLATLLGASVFLLGLILPNRVAKCLPILAAINLLLPQYLIIAVWMERIDDLQAISSMGMAIMILGMMLWPISFFFLWAHRSSLGKALLIDPFICGLPFLKTMWRQSQSSLVWGTLFGFALSIGNLAVPGILQVRVLTEEILVRFQTELNLWSVSILSLPLIFVSALLSMILIKDQTWKKGFETHLSSRFFRERIGKMSIMISAFFSCSTLAMGVCFPLISLLFSAETWGDILGTWKANQTAAMHSFIIAFSSSTLLLIGGCMIRKIKGRHLTWLVLIFPGTLLGAFLAKGNNHLFSLGIDLGSLIIAPALALRFLGIGSTGAEMAWRNVDERLINTARMEGISAWGQLRHCILPSAGKGLLTTWLLAYLLCLWEVEVLLFLVPPGIETIGLRVFNLLHYGHNSQVNALCLLLILIGIIPFAFWNFCKFSNRKDRKFCILLFLSMIFVGCGKVHNDHNDHNHNLHNVRDDHVESRFFSHARSIGFKGTGIGQFNKPRSIAVGLEDEIFAVDMTGRVQRFSEEGTFLGSWQMPETQRGRPKGMAVDASGKVIIVEPHYSRINHFSREGELLLQWGRYGKDAGSLSFPRSIALHSSGDWFVSEFQKVERVQRFSSDGSRFIQSFGEAGRDLGEFNRAEGIAFDEHDRLFVADSCNHRVQVFDEKGGPIAQYGRPGKALGEMSYPYDVRVDAAGYQFVCEFGNSRIQVFDPQFSPVEIIGGPGSELGQFSNPWSLAMDSHGNLWVADSGNHRLQKLLRHPKKQ